MNTLSYKRGNGVYFDDLANGDVFILNDKVYMKVSNKMLNQDGEKFTILYYDINKSYDFCVNLETGESREIAGGTLIEPLGAVEIRKHD